MDQSNMVPRNVEVRQPPMLLTQEEWEHRLLAVADDLAEREGIPVDIAWSIVQRHCTKRPEARYE